MTRNSTQTATGWKIVALAIIALGIGLHFVNLGKKIYWVDEAVTSLRISGYRATEMKQALFNGNDFNISELQKYQQINPGHGIISTTLTLVENDPQHPPFYYVLVRLWAGIMGDSPGPVRGFSAFITVCMIPFVYWLCLELFSSKTTAWMAMVLMAVSPFHLMYAQEARPYAQLMLMTVVASWLLLRAIRLQKARPWWIYAGVVGLGFYTHLMFFNVLLAHGIYLFVITWQEKGISRGAWLRLKPFLLSAVGCILLFVPWIIVIVSGSEVVTKGTNWFRAHRAFKDLVRSWIPGICSLIFEPQDGPVAPWSYAIRLPVLLLIGFSIYYLCRTTSTRTSLLIFALIFCTAISLIAPDLISGGRRSSTSRYWASAYAAMQLAVAHLLASQLLNARPAWRRFGQIVTGTVVAAGLVSCVIILQAETWWSKGNGAEMKKTARIINQTNSPLLIGSSVSSINMGYLLSLTHLLNNNVRMRFTQADSVPPLERDGTNEMFVLQPTEKMKQELEHIDDNRTLIPITRAVWLWQDKK